MSLEPDARAFMTRLLVVDKYYGQLWIEFVPVLRPHLKRPAL